MLKKLISTMLIGIIIIHMVATPTIIYAAAPEVLTITSEQPLTSGAVLKTYNWKFERNGQPVQVNANVVEVDLSNPNVKVDTMAGTNGQFTKKQAIKAMATETGAVAAVNGDFYNTQAEGVPMGPQMMDGKLLATPPYLPGFYTFAIDQHNKPIVELFSYDGMIKAANGATYPLGGINKTYYWFEEDGVHEEGKHSHIDGLFMYTHTWGQSDRSNDGVTNPTEVLVRKGVIEQIASGAIIDQVAPEDGYILRASGKADEFVKAHMKVGDKIAADYKVFAQDPNKMYDAAKFKMMIGGHTIMVDEGKPAQFSREVASLAGYRSRTAIGYSKDQRYVYLITADNSGDSKGLSMSELQQLMIKVGVWKGMNLDGGGSTQMVTRPLGEFIPVVTNQTEFGSERMVVNGVGVYSTAPKGEVKDILIQGNTTLFLKEKQTFQMKAYDEYYNPVDTSKMATSWTMSKPIGSMQGNEFTALQTGKATLTVTSGKVQKSIEVEVVGRDQIEKMEFEGSSPVLTEGTSYKMPIKVTTKTGNTRTIPYDSLTWEFKGFTAKAEGDRIIVDKIDKHAKLGTIIARYDGFSTITTMIIGERQVWADFDQQSYPISFNAYPDGVTGTAMVSDNVPGLDKQNKALTLSYDFTVGTETKAAYALFGDSGVSLAGEPQHMSMKVLGDASFNWLRAEVMDSKGKLQIIDITKNLDWNGWKTVNIDLTEYKLNYPISLKRLYIANPKLGQDERAAKGSIAFDDISFQYKSEVGEQQRNQVALIINKPTGLVNGKSVALEQAPVIVNDNTLIPVRFVVEAMGGIVGWEDAERKVTVLREQHLIEMWIDNMELIFDGKRVKAEVPPKIMNDKTMIPLRLIAESLGWKVGWEQKTQMVTLE